MNYMVLDILNDSLKYAFSEPKILIKMGLTNIFYILVIPYVFLCGYEYDVTKESINAMINSDNYHLPEFKLNKRTFVNGLKIVLVLFVYYFIPRCFYIIYIDMMDNMYIKLVYFLLLFISFTIILIAISNMIKHDSIKKAFDLKGMYILVKNDILFSNLLLLSFILQSILYCFDEILLMYIIEEIYSGLKLCYGLPSENIIILIICILFLVFIQPVLKLIIARSRGLIYIPNEE